MSAIILYNSSVMKFIDLLEKDKENLLTELAASKSADKAIRALENELDKLLLQYNEHCSSERERDAAAYMTQSIRLSLPLIDSVGETKVWETGSTNKSKGRLNPLVFILLAAGIVLCGIGLLPLLDLATDAGKEVDWLKLAGFELGGLAAGFVAGLLSRRSGPKPAKRTQRVETQVDAGKIYRSFRNAILAVDQNLDEIRSMERWNERDTAGQIDGHTVSSSELDIFSDLLAASYSQDPDYALEKIEEIKYYLHKQQIEVVDYSDETAAFFDMMPGQYAGTIRPALVADGTLMRKGIASKGTK